MKRYSTLLFSLSIALLSAAQTDHDVVTQGLSYNPAELIVSVGDNVNFTISATHPTTQVSEDTWNSNGTTPLPGGFGTNTSSFSITVTEPGVIYYVCDNHVGAGMKGTITVNPLSVDELVNEVTIDFGKMPIEDGVLRYSIDANENDLGMLKVINVSGQQVLEVALDSRQGQAQFLARPGTYIVLLEDRNGKIIYRETISKQ